MICEVCGNPTRVIDTVTIKGIVYRKRYCDTCQQKFGTKEIEIDIDDPKLKLAFGTRYKNCDRKPFIPKDKRNKQ